MAQAPPAASGAPASPAAAAPNASGGAVYKATGEAPPPQQLNAMLEDSLMRWNQAMQARDFKPFVAWQARAAQQYMKPDEDARASQAFVDNKIDFAEFKGVDPKVLVPVSLQDSPTFGKVLSTKVEYAKGGDTLQVAAKYLVEDAQWKVGEFKVEFDRKDAAAGNPSSAASPEANKPSDEKTGE